MRRAVIRLGPVFDSDAWEKAKRDEIKPGRWYYNPSGFRLLPDAGVWVDHDEGRRRGTVDELVRWSDGQGVWFAARGWIDDTAPAWLRQGTKASVGFIDLVENALGRGTRFGGGFVKEVLLVSPSQRPREAMAEVSLLYEPRSRGQEIAHPRGTVLRRPTGKILSIR